MVYKSKREIERIVDSKSEGLIEKTFGPSELSSGQVWEVWVYDAEEEEYYTRFVFDDGVNRPQYFSEFQQFCIFANKSLMKLQAEIVELNGKSIENEANIRQKNITLYVAAFVFIACSLTLLVLVFLDRAQGLSTIFLLGGLIASGARMFYGEWVRAGI